MEKTNLHDGEHVKRLAGIIRTSSQAEVEEEIRSGNSYGCSSLLAQQKILFAHRFDIMLGMNNVTPGQISSLGFNDYYRLLITEYNRAAQNLLIKEGYQNLGGAVLEMIFPTHIKWPFGEAGECLLLRQVSEPVILNDRSQPLFATINRYEIVGSHLPGNYFHILPMIRKGGVVLHSNTQKVVHDAAPFIYQHLPFTGAELEVLEELGKTNNTKKLGENLHKSANTIGEQLQHIRDKVKLYELGLKPKELARALKAQRIY